MPIIGLQRQLRTLGRIRTGNTVDAGKGKRRPHKLETFRLTSPSRIQIDAAAAAFGGICTPWTNPAGGPEFEVITSATSLDIVVPPGGSVSQWYELWTAAGCARRCDGQTNLLPEPGPCLCPADVDERLELAARGEACKATTRLRVILPALPDLGSWMLESHGYYAAVELAGAAEVLEAASEAGRLIPARLRLDQRTKKIPGQPTRQYAVPVIEFGETFAALVGGPTSSAPALAPGRRPELPAIAAPTSSTFRPALESSTGEVGTSCADVCPAGINAGAICVRAAGHPLSPGMHASQDGSTWPAHGATPAEVLGSEVPGRRSEPLEAVFSDPAVNRLES